MQADDTQATTHSQVTTALERIPGVDKAEVDLESGMAVVYGQVHADELIAALNEEGYDAKVQG